MAPYVSCISSHRNHSGCLAQVGVLGDMMRSIKDGRRGLEKNMCCLENSFSVSSVERNPGFLWQWS